MCLELGAYGADPLALYYSYPVDELLEWRRGLDHLQAIEDSRRTSVALFASGNLESSDSRKIAEAIDRNLIRPKQKPQLRKLGQSPF